MLIILLAMLGGIVLYGATVSNQSNRSVARSRENYSQPISTNRPIARPTTRPAVRPTAIPVACGTFSSPASQCRFSNGTTIRAAKAAQPSSRVRVTVRCGKNPCRFSHRDFELYSGARGEYPDRNRSDIPDSIAPNQTITITLKYRRYVGNESVLRFNAVGYVNAWLEL